MRNIIIITYRQGLSWSLYTIFKSNKEAMFEKPGIHCMSELLCDTIDWQDTPINQTQLPPEIWDREAASKNLWTRISSHHFYRKVEGNDLGRSGWGAKSLLLTKTDLEIFIYFVSKQTEKIPPPKKEKKSKEQNPILSLFYYWLTEEVF